MQFMLIYRETAADLAQRAAPDTAPAYWGAWNAYMGAMGQAGVLRGGHGLGVPETATFVQLRNGKRLIQDGPFADTKEHCGGYCIIEVASLDEALEWAARSPASSCGSTEVRPVLVPPSP